jgi:hypothetical protein
MKKILIVAAMAGLVAANSFGQGSVIFSNSGGAPVTIDDNAALRAPAGSTYRVELVYAPDGTATADFDSMAVRVGAAANFGPTPGSFSGGGRTVNNLTPAGGFGLFQVRGWTSAYGTDYTTGVAAGSQGGLNKAGKSNIVRVDTANPLIGEPDVSIVAAGLQGFSLTTVPEPSAIALGLLGAGTLLLLRRRK